MVSDDAKGDRHSLQSFHRIFISDVITSKQNTDPVRKRGENVLRLFFLVLIENNENNTEQWKTHKKQAINKSSTSLPFGPIDTKSCSQYVYRSSSFIPVHVVRLDFQGAMSFSYLSSV